MKKGFLFILIIVIFILLFSGCSKSKQKEIDDWFKKGFEDLSPTESLFLIALVIICFFLISISKSLQILKKEPELQQITSLLSDLSELKQITKLLSDSKILSESGFKKIEYLLLGLSELKKKTERSDSELGQTTNLLLSELNEIRKILSDQLELRQITHLLSDLINYQQELNSIFTQIQNNM